MRQPGAVGMSGPRRRLGRPGVSKPRHCRGLAPSGIRETAMIAPGPAMEAKVCWIAAAGRTTRE